MERGKLNNERTKVRKKTITNKYKKKGGIYGNVQVC